LRAFNHTESTEAAEPSNDRDFREKEDFIRLQSGFAGSYISHEDTKSFLTTNEHEFTLINNDEFRRAFISHREHRDRRNLNDLRDLRAFLTTDGLRYTQILGGLQAFISHREHRGPEIESRND